MKRSRSPYLAFVPLFMLLLFALPQAASASPGLPVRFYGDVSINLAPVPADTLVRASVPGAGPWTVPVSLNGLGMTHYVIDIPPDNPAIPGKDGAVEGDVVSFAVDLILAPQTGVWSQMLLLDKVDLLIDPVPLLLAPADGTVTLDNTPTLEWSDVVGPPPVTCRVQMDNNSKFSSPELDQVVACSSLTTPPLKDGHYSWRVRARTGMGWESGWTAAWRLSIVHQVTLTRQDSGSGWNVVTYTGVTEALPWTGANIPLPWNVAAIKSQLRAIWFWDNALKKWQGSNPNAPFWANDLPALEFGKPYSFDVAATVNFSYVAADGP